MSYLRYLYLFAYSFIKTRLDYMSNKAGVL
jgi:hypothetical protein